MTLPEYPLGDLSKVPSPALLVYRLLLEHNLDEMLAIAGSPGRLRPHCKTHKTREIVRLLLDRGVTRHKCATVREAAICIEAGACDIVLAYQLVGPMIGQFVDLASREPGVRICALVDSPVTAAFDQVNHVVFGDLDIGDPAVVVSALVVNKETVLEKINVVGILGAI